VSNQSPAQTDPIAVTLKSGKTIFLTASEFAELTTIITQASRPTPVASTGPFQTIPIYPGNSGTPLWYNSPGTITYDHTGPHPMGNVSINSIPVRDVIPVSGGDLRVSTPSGPVTSAFLAAIENSRGERVGNPVVGSPPAEDRSGNIT
jgi:hypothetical protein